MAEDKIHQDLLDDLVAAERGDIEQVDKIYPKYVAEQNDSSDTQDFRLSKWRWVALICLCFEALGRAYCYESPISLASEIKAKMVPSSSSYLLYSQLSSSCAYPGMIIPVFCGMFIDRIGLKICIIFLLITMAIGQGIFTAACYISHDNKHHYQSFIIAIIGRIIFGLSKESLWVCECVAICRWFLKRNLSFAFGIYILIHRLGSTLNYLISPLLCKSIHVGGVAMLGLGLCALGIISGSIFVLFERKATSINTLINSSHSSATDVWNFKWVKEITKAVWLLSFCLMFGYCAMFTFAYISNRIFEKEYELTSYESLFISSLIYAFAVPLTPLVGMFIDKRGKRVSICIIACSILVIAHLLFLFLVLIQGNKKFVCLLPTCLIGLVYCGFSVSIWTIVPTLVKPEYYGSIFGMITAIQNVGIAFGPLIVSLLKQLRKNAKDYFPLNIFFALCSIIALILAIYILKADQNSNKEINEILKSRSVCFKSSLVSSHMLSQSSDLKSTT